MKWRLVGPFRGGRALAVTGVPGAPDTFYFGGVAGAGLRRPTPDDLDPSDRQGNHFEHRIDRGRGANPT